MSTAIPESWQSVPRATAIGAVVLDDDGNVTTTVMKPVPRIADGPVRLTSNAIGPYLANGEKALTEPFLALDSFDYSESRGEVVFSAKRDEDFDIGLVSSDGSAINWAPDDPADEVAVQWAPRGNKVSYVLRGAGGDVVRTLHIPTSYSFALDFPSSTVHGLSWDAAAERFAVIASSPDSSDRVELLAYDGSSRKVLIAPAQKLAADVEPIGSGAIVLRPHDVRYDEKLPLVVWVADDFGWSDERAALFRNARVALVVTRKRPDEALWRSVSEIAWIDSSRPIVAGAEEWPGAGDRVTAFIAADPAVAQGRYERSGKLVRVAPAVVQSFSAGFIADQVKRITPTNGSSR